MFRRRREDDISVEKPLKRGYGVTLGSAMAEFEAVLSPAAEYRIVEMRSQEEIADVDWSGQTEDT